MILTSLKIKALEMCERNKYEAVFLMDPRQKGGC